MDDRRADLERIELLAMRDFFDAAPTSLGVAVEEVGSASLFFSRVGPAHLLNRAVGLGLDGEVSGEAIDRLCTARARHGLEWTLSLWPDARPADLERQLLERGFERGYAWMKFRRGVDRIPPVETSLRVERASASDGRAFASVVCAGYDLPAELAPWLGALAGRPDWDVLVAWDGYRPVAAGAVYSRDRLAWLGFAATLPSHRRWGGQSALIAEALSCAAARGVETAVAETGERVPGKPSASYRNLLRHGFEEVYLRQNLRCPAAAVERAVGSAAAGVS